jgi:uncharacterized protein
MGAKDKTLGKAKRRLPALTPVNKFFWTAGEYGHLKLLRCDSCRHWLHPPAPICPECLGRSLTPQMLSGLGEIMAVTIHHQSWTSEVVAPYAVVLVGLDECPNVRLTSRLVTDDPDKAVIGRRVRVVFEHHEDVWLPFFELAGDAA